jgi:hypothetical protein
MVLYFSRFLVAFAENSGGGEFSEQSNQTIPESLTNTPRPILTESV